MKEQTHECFNNTILFSDRHCGHADLAIWIATYFEIQSALGEVNPVPCKRYVC